MSKRILMISGGTVDQTFLREYRKDRHFDRIYAVDKGIEAVLSAGIVPDVLIGDFDSADSSLLQKVLSEQDLKVLRLNPVKDQTDTEAAIYYALSEQAEEIHILGATGSRMDHFLGNIEVLMVPLKEGVPCVLADPCNRIRLLSAGNYTYRKETIFGQWISYLPLFGPVRGVTLSGMKYPLSHADFIPGNSLGVSNELTAEKASLSFEEGFLLEIQSKDEQ